MSLKVRELAGEYYVTYDDEESQPQVAWLYDGSFLVAQFEKQADNSVRPLYRAVVVPDGIKQSASQAVEELRKLYG